MVLQNGKWMAATEATSDAVPTIGQSEKLTTFTTKDGKKFENAKITVTATGISVITPDGGASVAFDRLPDNLAPFPEATRSQIHDGQTAAAEAKAEETKANAPPPPESSSLGSLWASLSSFMESMLHRVQAFFSSSTSSSTPAAPAAPIEPAPAAPAAPATVTPPTPTNATATPAPVNLPTSGELVNLVSGRLVSADGNSVTLPPSTIQYYAIYYSAQWCPPCHAFSPRLVSWYNKFKPAHPNFELIFVSEDHDEAAMFNYMKEMSMPWPAFRFDRLMHDGNGTFQGPGIEQYAGKGIPDLVLVDATGKVLSDSYHGDQYFGPESVVDDINKIVGGSAPVPLGQQRPALPHSTPTLITSQGSTAGLGFPSGT
jgi:thiol-disulfide isomerase/thioredoxin